MSAATNLISTITPVAAAGVATTASTAGLAPEWSFAVQLLAGAAILLALISNGVNIWRSTRAVPPIGEQIQKAIGGLEERQAREFRTIDKRLDAHAQNIRVLEQSVAALNERTHRRPTT